MHFLITGGAGFIGTNLTKKLLEEGHNVRILDNFRAGRKENRIHRDAEYIEGNIRVKRDLMNAMRDIDGVFHMAAIPRVPNSIITPIETNETNVVGTLNVLVAARDSGVKRVVYSSSSSVYGGGVPGKSLQEDMPARPLSPYGLQKYAGEEYCRIFPSLYDLKTVSLRYFNVYGPYFDPDGDYALVIGKFFKQKMGGKPMTVCGDGEYFRDYTNVHDVVRANIAAMTSDEVGNGEAINVGAGDPRSVNQLVETIGGDYILVDARQGDPRWTKADISRAKELLSWEPQVTFEDGVEALKREWGI